MNIFFLKSTIDLICVYVFVYVCTALVVGGQPTKSVFSFYYVGPRDRIQMVRLGGKHTYLLNHLTGPIHMYF